MGNQTDESSKVEIEALAKEIIGIERQCFYGDELERDRLKKLRVLIINAADKEGSE